MSGRQQQQEGSFWGTFFKLGAVAAAGAATAAAVYYATSEPGTSSGHSAHVYHESDSPRSRPLEKWATNAERVSGMVEAFRAGMVECGICLSNISSKSGIWTCSECYTSFHPKCVSHWAHAADYRRETTWECPMCRHCYDIATTDFSYKCFCGNVSEPRHIPGKTPHTCDDVCRRDTACVLKCHPGPCVFEERRSAQ